MNWLRLVGITGSLGGRWKSVIGLKQILHAVAIIASLVVAFLFSTARVDIGWKSVSNSTGCDFPAIFNFGDSNSDTGGTSAMLRRFPSPNGKSFFARPSGRVCDGRLVIDFIAEKLRLPYLSAYLDSIGANYRHGANFATSGSTIQPLDTRMFLAGFSPISLDVQVLQFEQFKDRVIELYSEGEDVYVLSHLPRPEDFSKALYTLDIGQNDLHSGLKSMTENQLLSSIPNIIDLFANAIQKLYQLEARIFWIHNTGPFGCLPIAAIEFPQKPDNIDQDGCVKSYNVIAQVFNMLLKDRVSHLREELPEAVLIYTDIYAAKHLIISGAKEHGFVNPLKYCCGHFGDYRVRCGRKAMVNGTEIFGVACSHPEEYISWDGIHYSQAVNQIVATKILDGPLSDPSTSINEACHKPQL